MRWPGGELHDGDVGARLGQPRLVLGQPEEVQGAGMNSLEIRHTAIVYLPFFIVVALPRYRHSS